MDLAEKLQTKDAALAIVNAPKGFAAWTGPTAKDPKSAKAVLVFMRNADELRVYSAPLVAAARRDVIAYLAYPKAGQLGTDLTRDNIWVMLQEQGIRPVRQIAIDDVWSALRFRPAEEE
ncbi:MAG: hypothetical protein QOC71_709 [Thermoplasmata archaeon]|nr:hypothetical protein [Thermoplasmata archaeon]